MTSPSPSGLLLVDKPVGPTSHDMVARVRRRLGTRRVGHAGTLDPFASGLLLVCVGQATRLVEYLHLLDKVYEAEALLGVTTTTDDPEGETEVTAPPSAWSGLTSEAVRAALEAQVGAHLQQPPVYSAKKVGGKAAHRRVREGEAVDLPPVPVRIDEVTLLSLELPRVRFRVRCGTGTYIRSMARDLGAALRCGAHLTELRRTAIGPFAVETAAADEASWPAALLAPLAALPHLPTLSLSEDEVRRVRMGQRIRFEQGAAEGLVALVDPSVAGGALVGVASWEEGLLRPRKILPDEGAA